MIDIYDSGLRDLSKCPVCGSPYSSVEYGKVVYYACGSEWSLQSNAMAHKTEYCEWMKLLKQLQADVRELESRLKSAQAEQARLRLENENLKLRLAADSEYMLALECSNDELRQEAGYVQ